MTDRDNITLPREVGEHLMWVLEECPMHGDWEKRDVVALVALREALAAPRLEVTVDPRLTPEEAAAISSALAAPKPEPVRCNPADYCAARHMNLYTAPPNVEALRRDAERWKWVKGVIGAEDAAIDAAMGEKR